MNNAGSIVSFVLSDGDKQPLDMESQLRDHQSNLKVMMGFRTPPLFKWINTHNNPNVRITEDGSVVEKVTPHREDNWDLVLHSDKSFSSGVHLYEFIYQNHNKLKTNHNEFLIGWHPKNDSTVTDYFTGVLLGNWAWTRAVALAPDSNVNSNNSYTRSAETAIWKTGDVCSVVADFARDEFRIYCNGKLIAKNDGYERPKKWARCYFVLFVSVAVRFVFTRRYSLKELDMLNPNQY
jgi:hypothetical protein